MKGLSMYEKCCENCLYSRDMGYRQVICGKTNKWQPYLYCCDWWKEKIKETK